jgi:dihydroorotase
LVDVESEWKVDRNMLQSRSKNTPYDGRTLPAVITEVFTHGKLKLKNGEITK